MRSLFAIIVAAGFPATLAAQPQLSIRSAFVFPQRPAIAVEFSEPVDSSGPHTEKDKVHLRGATRAQVVSLARSIRRTILDVTFSGELPVGRPVEICFEQVRFLVGAAAHETTREVCRALGTQAEAAQAQAAALQLLKEVPKGSRDKDIFASGFVTTASEESAGGADLSLNPDFKIPNLESFLQIKKATADEGDAKHFEAGARYRYAGTWKPGQMRQIAETLPGTQLNELLHRRQSNVFAGWLLDVAGKLEGDPTNFDVTNFVSETAFQLRTMTKGFGGRKGFWRGFLLPGGLEVGQSLGTPASSADTPAPAQAIASEEVNRIVRLKAGAGFTVYYDNPGTQLPLRRIELDINGVLRHLILTESRFNSETKKIDTTADGLHGYAQIDVKVFFGETNAGRYGFKLSFNRGRLPPVYAHVKSFDFGFVIESGDDDGKTTAERKASASGRPAPR